jgi:hypothetical protein
MPTTTQRKLRALLAAIACAGLLTAWWHYPPENRFSILSCTISFLGSPDADRNPQGWRYYQAGMSALVALLFLFAAERHGRLRAPIGRTAAWSSGAIFLALAMILVAVWVVDTRRGRIFGFRTGEVHTRIAVMAIPLMGCGIVLDAVALMRAGARWIGLWPFHLYGLITGVGIAHLIAWEEKCRRNPALQHWPGDGLHSTPLWEWIVFVYLIGFLFWMAHGNVPLASGARGDSR